MAAWNKYPNKSSLWIVNFTKMHNKLIRDASAQRIFTQILLAIVQLNEDILKIDMFFYIS